VHKILDSISRKPPACSDFIEAEKGRGPEMGRVADIPIGRSEMHLECYNINEEVI